MPTELDLSRPQSAQVYAQSCAVIPGGVNSPVRAFPGLDQTPLVISSGYLDEIVDVDGHRYIDYCLSWGALLHGHAHPKIVQAAQKQIAMGSTFGTATPGEALLAKKVTTQIPSIEKVRFVSSGTEACMSALRLARGFTGRSAIAKFIGHYHGHADPLLVQAGSGCALKPTSAGVPQGCIEETHCLPFNDMDACRTFLRTHEVAAVILEPIAANMGVVPPKPDFLEMLREETARQGALLIFDEVITGFRVSPSGAQGLYDITPDLTCLGKIVGGGFPAAAFGGRAEIMDHLAPQGDVYQAGTLSGNPVAMAAGLQALSMLEGIDLAERTTALTVPIQEEIQRRNLNACVNESVGMFTLFFGQREVTEKMTFDLEFYARFFRYLFEKGIYWSPSQYEAVFLSPAHSAAHLAKTRDAILAFLRTL